MENYDVAVIGGGPGGYVAAIRAAQLGKKVALIEKEHLGGICLNWGCIPTKALLKSAEIFETIKHAADYGIHTTPPTFDVTKIVERSRSISAKLTAGIKSLMQKNKITIIEGVAYIKANKIIEITSLGKNNTIKASNIIVATGGRSRTLQGFEADGKLIWTSREAMIPKEMPKSLVIIGAGAIGIEFASFYKAFGVDVTILEAKEQILPAEDVEISALARKIFNKKGIKIHTGIQLENCTKNSNSVTVNFIDKNQKLSLTTDKLLVAIGIVANTENLGLENTKVKTEHGHIITDGYMQTTEFGIYAIGDVAGAPWLAHKASHEGIIAAEHIAGLKTHSLNKTNIPGCTYSLPQIASVGLTEDAAKKLGIKLKIGRFPFLANGKALVLGEPEGMIKTIFAADTGELLGAHMIGAEVTELIQGYVVAKGMEGTDLDLINTIFAHPTLSEMMHEAVLNSDNRAIHI